MTALGLDKTSDRLRVNCTPKSCRILPRCWEFYKLGLYTHGISQCVLVIWYRQVRYSQPHLIGTWLIGSSGSDQDFTPDNHCYDRQVACLSVITMAYQVRNLDHFLNSQLTRFRLSGVDCNCFDLYWWNITGIVQDIHV